MNINNYAGVSPEDAIAFFEGKGLSPSYSYMDTWNKQHQTAFTAAKALQLSVLQTLKENIDNAIRDGVPYAEFQKTIKPLLAQQGWWGRVPMVDPKTGKKTIVNIGPSRLKVIYDTNLRTAHAEGQWKRIKDSKESFPYLRFQGCNSARPRPEHCALTGTTLPVDSPTWDYLMPPLAFRCKCRVRQVMEGEGKVSKEPKADKVIHTNPRTGEKTVTHQIKVTGVDPKTGQSKDMVFKSSPAFSYPKGNRLPSLTKHTNAEGKVTQPYTKNALIVQKALTAISTKHKALRDDIKTMSPVKQRAALGDIGKEIAEIDGLSNQQLAALAAATNRKTPIEIAIESMGNLIATLAML
ncbi:MAG: minor capsid protein [Thiotrichaceae bacterium]|nr:minor capsid protein [Thiotrichaceae bacterium]